MSIKVGLQLYSVRDSMSDNPVLTLEKVASIGYKNIEVANHDAANEFGVGFGVSASQLNEILGRFGSRVVSAHIWPFNEENCQKIIAYNQQIGNSYIVHPIDFFKNEDDVLAKCEFYNKMGEICTREGMKYLYHNHYMEFQRFNGKPVLEIIRDNTDPEMVNFELDTFWTLRGGQDPVKVMKEFGSRIKLLHQKDFNPQTSTPLNLFNVVGPHDYIDMETFVGSFSPDDFTEIGTGSIDIQSIINTANELGSVEYIILEQDYSQLDQLESIEVSMQAFKKFTGIEWA